MIHPLQPYPLRGVIWYQGEANATADRGAIAIATSSRALIRALARRLGAAGICRSCGCNWPTSIRRRRAVDAPRATARGRCCANRNRRTLALPATAQAVTIDIGNADDIHPRDKQEVGRRLALAARHVAYGESLVYSGPVYRAAKFEGRSARSHSICRAVRWRCAAAAAVHGFELAGDDHRFHPARAGSRATPWS